MNSKPISYFIFFLIVTAIAGRNLRSGDNLFLGSSIHATSRANDPCQNRASQAVREYAFDDFLDYTEIVQWLNYTSCKHKSVMTLTPLALRSVEHRALYKVVITSPDISGRTFSIVEDSAAKRVGAPSVEANSHLLRESNVEDDFPFYGEPTRVGASSAGANSHLLRESNVEDGFPFHGEPTRVGASSAGANSHLLRESNVEDDLLFYEEPTRVGASSAGANSHLLRESNVEDDFPFHGEPERIGASSAGANSHLLRESNLPFNEEPTSVSASSAGANSLLLKESNVEVDHSFYEEPTRVGASSAGGIAHRLRKSKASERIRRFSNPSQIKRETCNSISTIVIDAGIHAREWAAAMSGIYIISQILQNYANINCMQYVILPMVNPDGYEYSRKNNRNWRKNRAKHSICPGVDLNRNFDIKWEDASNWRCSEVYRGPSRFSEPESRAVRDVIHSYNPNAYVTIHSHGGFILYPYGYTNRKASPNKIKLIEMGNAMAAAIEKKHGSRFKVGQAAIMLGAAAGGSDDWVHEVAAVPYSYTLELDPYTKGFEVTKTKLWTVIDEGWTAIKAMVEKLRK